MKFIYLDTSRIINLARRKNDKYWIDIDNLLHDGNHVLVLSSLHVYEFSRGSMEKDTTACYLDTLPLIRWAIPPWYIWQAEVKGTLDYILTKNRNSINITHNSFFAMCANVNAKYKNLRYSLKQPKTITELLYSFKEDGMYKELDVVPNFGVKVVKDTKENARIWRNWKAVLRQRIHDYWPKTTEHGLQTVFDNSYAERMLAISDEFLPSLTFTTKLERIKFSNNESVEPNDFLDELHASYAPYCDVIMHDMKTCRRALQTGSAYAYKFVAKQEDLLRTLIK